jgi:hypothetical protein
VARVSGAEPFDDMTVIAVIAVIAVVDAARWLDEPVGDEYAYALLGAVTDAATQARAYGAAHSGPRRTPADDQQLRPELRPSRRLRRHVYIRTPDEPGGGSSADRTKETDHPTIDEQPRMTIATVLAAVRGDTDQTWSAQRRTRHPGLANIRRGHGDMPA